MGRNLKDKVCTGCLLLKSISYNYEYASDELCMDCKKGDRRCRTCNEVKSYKRFGRNKRHCKECERKNTMTEKRKDELRSYNEKRVFMIENEMFNKIVI